MKICAICKSSLSLSEFTKLSRSKDGLSTRCKFCVSKCNQKAYRDNRESRLEYSKEYGAKRYAENKESILKKQREAYAKNPQKKLEQNAKYRNSNPERELERQRIWRNENKEWSKAKWRNASSKRRAMIARNGVYLVSKKEISKLLSMPCIYCGTMEDLSIEHVVPIHRGGTHGIGNLATACIPCNSSKGKKFITEWRKQNPITRRY